MPIVSIILPTYNRSLFIKSAIQSALEQTYADYELIVVDDGSTDDTVSLVKEFTDDRLIYVAHNQNKGAAAARNTGMRLSRGQYIAFLDSDDTWHRQKLEKQIQFLMSQPELGGCVTSYRLVFEKYSIIREVLIEDDFYKQSLRGCNLSPGTTLLFRKDCLEKVGFQNEILKRFEDWEWQIRFARCYKWQRVPVVLADIRAGHTVNFKTVKHALCLFENLITEVSVKNKKIIKMAIYYELFYAACKSFLWKSALNYFVKSLLSNPVNFMCLLSSLIKRKVKEFFKIG